MSVNIEEIIPTRDQGGIATNLPVTLKGSSGIVPGAGVFKSIYAGGVAPLAATSGTDTTPADGKVFISAIQVPHTMSITGISYLIGSVGGTDKAIAILFDSDGNVVANSATAGTTVGTAANFQRLAFTEAYTAKGPGLYYVGIVMDGTTARLRTHAAGDHPTDSVSQTFGTPVAITPPTTFTADEGPIAVLY
jgi:hypothetical protein